MTSVVSDFDRDLRVELIARLNTAGHDTSKLVTTEDTCVAYFNVRHRRIEPRPRTVQWSRELRSKASALRQELRDGIARIEQDAASGASLDRYLSNGVRYAPARQDGLRNDWGQNHLHLGPPAPNNGPVERRDEVLFVYETGTTICFIDVRPHGEWANKDLLAIMHGNWPEVMAAGQLAGAVGVEVEVTSADVATLRKARINTITSGPGGAGAFVGLGGGVVLDKKGTSRVVMGQVRQLMQAVTDLESATRSRASAITNVAGVTMNLSFDDTAGTIHLAVSEPSNCFSRDGLTRTIS